MENILEIAKQNNLSLTEFCILFRLNKRYPRAVSMDEITTDARTYWYLKRYISKLVAKGFVDIRGEKYRLKK